VLSLRTYLPPRIHGGAATSEVVPQQVFHDEYLSLFANSYEVPQYDFVIFGGSRAGATPLVEKSISALRKDA
jgi:hypothetical protein